jgi:hypothetical protein
MINLNWTPFGKYTGGLREKQNGRNYNEKINMCFSIIVINLINQNIGHKPTRKTSLRNLKLEVGYVMNFILR